MKINFSLTSVTVACALFAITAIGCGKKEAAPATDASATTPAATTPAAPTTETAPATTPAATTGATGEGTTKTVKITNQTTFDVNYIYLSPVEETTWGSDILGENDVLKPGASVDVEITCGKWDAQLVAVDGSKCEVENVDICSADTWNVTADCPGAE